MYNTDTDAETDITKTAFISGLFSTLNLFSDLALSQSKDGESYKCVCVSVSVQTVVHLDCLCAHVNLSMRMTKVHLRSCVAWPRIATFSTLSAAQKDVQLDAPECLCSKLLYINKTAWGGCAAEDASCFFLPFQIRLWQPVKNEKNTGEGDMMVVMIVAATCGR